MNAIQVYGVLNKKIKASATSISYIELINGNQLKFTMADGSNFIVEIPLKTNCIDFQVVLQLPTLNISETTIYFVPVQTYNNQKRYLQYMYINDQWECLGDNTFDIDNYYTKSEVEALINSSLCPIATISDLGLVKPDGSSINIDADGKISVSKTFVTDTVKSADADIEIDTNDITSLF